ncbi:MAG TPA: hypothetical protein VJT75_08415 [Thermoleophilaceae bacterium]|nr:hypothetical protein [Thermoleophilaceae bacterium]
MLGRRVVGRARVALLSVLVAGAISGASASSAEAWYAGNVYVVVSNGHCVGGGRIVFMQAAVDVMWSGGDWGDNILYPRVRIGDTNTINVRALCDRAWYQGPDYWINVVGRTFRPTYNGQTIWL